MTYFSEAGGVCPLTKFSTNQYSEHPISTIECILIAQIYQNLLW